MRIYSAKAPFSGEFSIVDDNLHYLKNVLRVSPGKKIEILTEEFLLQAEVLSVDKKSIVTDIQKSRLLIKPDYKFFVYQCILKREYMDNVIEKYTELGVTDIIPVISARSTGEVKENTVRRFRQIITSAALQSEQEFIPCLHNTVRLSDIKPCDGNNIVFYERGYERGFPEINSSKVSIVIGPEGGFEFSELGFLADSNFNFSTPSSSILKAETAAVVFAGYVSVCLNK